MIQNPLTEKKSVPKKKLSEKVVRQYTMSGTYIQEFKSTGEAAKSIGLKPDSITDVMSGRRNSAGGFIWKKCDRSSPRDNIVP